MPVILSICIPTYNRAAELRRTLAAVFQQVGAASSRVEVVVSDNGSTDDTPVVVAEYLQAGVRSVRSAKNLGFDKNCDAAVRAASGRFVWLVSDDDFMLEGAIARVCSLLEENQDVVFAFVNYSVVQPDGEEPSACATTGVARLDAQRLVPLTKFAFSFVGSCVFSREQWLSADVQRYFGGGWVHLFMARDVLLNGEALLIGERLVMMRGLDLLTSRKEKVAEHQQMEFYMGVHLRFLEFAFSLEQAGYTPRVASEAVAISWVSNLRQIIYYKATRDRYLLKELVTIARGMSRFFGERITFWLLHVPILFAPNAIVAAVYFCLRPLYRKLKHRGYRNPSANEVRPLTGDVTDG